ncbi:hypothetical protein OVX87_31920 [Klebsiella pneumoniae]|nr:hypothetical protein [Klebsiella pneumoniae]
MAIVKNDKIRHAPDSMIIQDGVLYAIADEAMYFDEVAPTPQYSPARDAAAQPRRRCTDRDQRPLPRRIPGAGKTVRQKDELEKYQHIHQSAVTQQADGFSY